MASKLLAKIDLAKGIKAKWVQVPDMELTVLVELDAELQKLIDGNKAEVRWQNLLDEAQDYVEPAIKKIKQAVEQLDDKIASLNGKERDDMIKQVSSVLKQVAVGQEQGVNKAVEDCWRAAVRRQDTLSKYKFKCASKAIVGAIAISAALTSMVASAGANLLGVVSIFKTVAELAILVAEISEEVDETAKSLDLELTQLRRQVEDEGQPSRTKEVVSDLSAIIGKCMTTVKTADSTQVRLEAKIASVEKNADSMMKSINQGQKKLEGIKTAEDDKKDYIKGLEDETEKLLNKIESIQKDIRPYTQFNESASKEVAEWKSKRLPKTDAALKGAFLAKTAAGLLSAARTFAKVAGAPVP